MFLHYLIFLLYIFLFQEHKKTLNSCLVHRPYPFCVEVKYLYIFVIDAEDYSLEFVMLINLNQVLHRVLGKFQLEESQEFSNVPHI